jgi:hypothetical protein
MSTATPPDNTAAEPVAPLSPPGPTGPTGANASGLAPDYRALTDAAWRDQATWSALAGQLKTRIAGWRRVAAVCGVAGAVGSTLAGQLKTAGLDSAASALALAAAALLAVVPVVLQRLTSAAQVGAWTRTRATSEGLKGAIYRFLLQTDRSADAAADTVPPDAAAFVQRCDELRKNVADLSLQAAAMPPTDKQRPTTLTLDAYINERLLAQCNGYYDPHARTEAQAALRLRRLELALSLLATVLGFLASPLASLAGLPNLPAAPDAASGAAAGAAGITVPALLASWAPWASPWPAVLTAAASAVASHLAAARHEALATVYRATAQRLRSLHTLWSLQPGRYGATEAAALVDAVEVAIATENGAWLADWGKAAEAT